MQLVAEIFNGAVSVLQDDWGCVVWQLSFGLCVAVKEDKRNTVNVCRLKPILCD